jgi:tRNA(Ile)-lysidine synthase
VNSVGLIKPSKRDLRTRVDDALRSDAVLLAAEDVAVIAVSGGLDSTCLARLLAASSRTAGVRWVLAHVQHGLRPNDAAVELRAVRRMAADLKLELRVGELKVAEDLTSEVGLEASARQVRLGWLTALADELGAGHVFLGHHRDDQLETILLRRAEGLSVDLAPGMAARRGVFCRPLLGVARDELSALAHEEGWTWVEDSSNQDERFARNALRHTEIPFRRRQDGSWEGRILREGEAARAQSDALGRRAKARFADLLSRAPAPASIRLARADLSGAPSDEVVWLLQRLCPPALSGGRGPGRRALQALIRALESTTETRVFDLGAGWSARLDAAELFLRRDCGPLPLEGVVPVGARLLSEDCLLTWSRGLRLGMVSLSAASAQMLLAGDRGAGTSFAIFDADSVALPLSVQGTGSGRKMTPFGMQGQRSLRDLLAESGVPRADRASYPLVLDQTGTPLWLPGVRSSACAALISRSERAVMLYTVAAFGYDPAVLEMDS